MCWIIFQLNILECLHKLLTTPLTRGLHPAAGGHLVFSPGWTNVWSKNIFKYGTFLPILISFCHILRFGDKNVVHCRALYYHVTDHFTILHLHKHTSRVIHLQVGLLTTVNWPSVMTLFHLLYEFLTLFHQTLSSWCYSVLRVFTALCFIFSVFIK